MIVSRLQRTGLGTSMLNVGGGVMVMAANSVTPPVLYSLMPASSFSAWAAALALLNFSCFPEIAVNLATAVQGESDRRLRVTAIPVLVVLGLLAFCIGAGVEILFGQRADDPPWQDRLAVYVVLSFAVPVRLYLSQIRGRLARQSAWVSLNVITTASAVFSAALFITLAAFGYGVLTLAVGYVMVQAIQLWAASQLQTADHERKKEPTDASGHLPWYRLLLFGVGPVIMTQGDRLGLYYVFSSADYAVYILCAMVGTQLNAVGSLASQHLITHQQTSVDPRQALTSCTWLNMAIVTLGAVCCVGVLPHLLVLLGKPVPAIESLALLAAVFGALALNSPGYFFLIGMKRWPEISWVVLGAALTAVVLCVLLGRSYGVNGAILGNLGYIGTLWFAYQAARAVGAPGLWRSVAIYASLLSTAGILGFARSVVR